jgi:tetratricopeptide (TPR) repeat protein
MKLVKGGSLAATLLQRPDPATDRGRLLAVFEAVCQAVGYAHAHRVLHRDLKPANVMVGAFGEVQVMDWGLAKVLGEPAAAAADPLGTEPTRAWTEISPAPESGSHTQAGSLVGTPAFIPPEQAGGEVERVNERSDVFGLGALLAVILTGQPPYVGATAESVRLMAVRGQLEDCFARLDACGAEPELVALCKHCLAFEPADRPRDAGAVAAAVAGLRAAAEERARAAERDRAAAAVRAAEQRHRRRWQVTAAALVVLALAGGVLGLGLHLRAQAQANADLEAKNAALAAANERERQRFQLALDAIGLFTDDVSQDLLLKQKEFEGLRTRLLRNAAAFHGKLEAHLKDQRDPASRAALGRAYFELGELTEKIGSKAEALALHRKALAIRRELAAGGGAGAETPLDVARSLGGLGKVLLKTDDVAGALRVLEEQRTLATALAAELKTDAARAVLAQSHNNLGDALVKSGKMAASLVSHRTARALLQELADAHPTNTAFQHDLAHSHFVIGNTLSFTGEMAEGLASFQAARAIFQKLADAHPAVTEFQSALAKVHSNTGFVLWETGKPAEALASVRAAQALARELADAYPAVSQFQFSLAHSHFVIGIRLVDLGKPAQGLTSLRTARARFQKLADDHPTYTRFQRYPAVSDLYIGKVLLATGEPAEALAMAEAARALVQKLADDHPTWTHRSELAICHIDLADVHRSLGRRDEARAGYLAAIALAEQLTREQPLVPLHFSLQARALRRLGLTRLADGDAAGAAGATRRALGLFNGLPTRSGEEWFETACCHAALATLAGRDGAGVPAAEGAAQANQALSLLRKAALDMSYRNAGAFRTETALDGLRDRADFRDLLAEIEALNQAEAAKDRDAGTR